MVINITIQRFYLKPGPRVNNLTKIKGINMKKMILIAIALFTAKVAVIQILAQGTLYVSNLAQTPTGSSAVGSDSWIAQTLITGTNPGGYMLDSVQLLMNAASGNPSGFTVSLYSYSSSTGPASNLGNLSGSDPSAGGIFTYTAADLMLSPSTSYCIVVTTTTPVTEGVYVWSIGSSPYYIGSESWEIYDVNYNSTDGLSWTGHLRQRAFQMAIYAAAVPEPTTLALAALGLAALSFWRRKPNFLWRLGLT
jgi:hypothetical protein